MAEWAVRFARSVFGWFGASLGLLLGFWTGLPELAQGVLITQFADVATGLACAVLGKSRKSESGKVSSRVMLEGVIRKGCEWLVVWVCVAVGTPLGFEGIGAAAMTYVIATELVSLLENLELLGLDVPLLKKVLDVAHSAAGKKEEKEA